MSDTLIQDNALKGSPILSYGQSGPKRVWSGLFAIVLIGLGILVVLNGVLFWFFTKIPVPENAVLIVILPAGSQLPSSAPDTWLSAVDQNKVLPTVVGFTAIPGQVPEPFAIKAPSLFDLNFLKTGQWPLRTNPLLPPPYAKRELDGVKTRISYKSPAELFGLPFKQKKAILTINLKNLLSGPGAEFKDLPEFLSGPMNGNVWQTGLKSDEQFSFSREDSGTGGFAPVEPQASMVIKNAFASQGITLGLPGEGILSWGADPTMFGYEFISSVELSKDAKIGLLEAKDIFDLADYTLPDQVVVKAQRPPVAAFASNTHFFADDSFKFTLPADPQLNLEARSSKLEEIKCQGKVLAVFDQPAIESMCSWLGFCFIQPQRLIVAEQNSQINFCYSDL